jgi:hypothetical protein
MKQFYVEISRFRNDGRDARFNDIWLEKLDWKLAKKAI